MHEKGFDIIKRVFSVFTALFTLVNALMFTQPVFSATPVIRTGASYIFTTSHDSERYAKMTVKGDTIYIEGRFTGDKIKDFFISVPSMGSMKQSLKTNSDGSFSGYFGGVPTSDMGYAVITFESGKQLAYRVDYGANGWFFSVNGLDEYTMDNVENYMTVSDEVSAYYVTENLDVAQTRETLEEIRRIAFEVTDGINDDYEKAKSLSEWVSDNIYYDYDARDTEVTLSTVTLENVLKTKSTVCTGYANLYAALLEAVGIKAVNIQGGVVSSGKCSYEELAVKTVKHEWVAFFYEQDNRWVYTDVVWDSGNTYQNGKYIKGNLPMKYFDIDGLALSLDHRGDKAELRNYMNAAEYVQNGVKVSEETTQKTDDVTAGSEAENEETRAETRTNDLPDIAAKEDYSDNNPNEPVDDMFLYAAIAALSAGVIIALAVFIKVLKGKI